MVTISMHVLVSVEFLKVLLPCLFGMVTVLCGKNSTTNAKMKQSEKTEPNSQGRVSDSNGADSGDMEKRGNG